ncbi:MAG TPA: DUF1848 domain-containing protein [Spirochaetota bacterium]|nr:DUF1848 domain-containing protein [Spirochaetota bacterium]HPJ34178.1 DUF1848 domain-containing protein [Spirochaetota bacterium]
MIISASRRTDIPAFYSDWFINRVRTGYLFVRNPMNSSQITKISLSPEMVDCIVFWTKNPLPIIKSLNILDKFQYYFHFTLTPYDSSIEMNLPSKIELIDTFRRLSDTIGPSRIIWRYDPVFFTYRYNLSSHLNFYETITKKLEGYTKRCMYSFLTVYRKCEKNMKGIDFSVPDKKDSLILSESFSSIASSSGIELQTCAVEDDLSCYGIKKGKCIDDSLISELTGKNLFIPEDRNQRKYCQCAESIDIGAYNTCTHRCVYCYANYDHELAIKNFERHNPGSDLLSGTLNGSETIREKKNKNYSAEQLKLF